MIDYCLYASEGDHAELGIDLPPGSYIPEFIAASRTTETHVVTGRSGASAEGESAESHESQAVDCLRINLRRNQLGSPFQPAILQNARFTEKYPALEISAAIS